MGCTRNRTLGGATMALNNYNDNEAVRSRGQDLVSTKKTVTNTSAVSSTD